MCTKLSKQRLLAQGSGNCSKKLTGYKDVDEGKQERAESVLISKNTKY
jgi:hypothetical protein